MAHSLTGPRLAAAMLASAVVSFGTVAAGVSAVTDQSRGTRAEAAAHLGAPGGASAFVRRVVRLIAENRYDEAWPLLHPAHRRAAGRNEFVRCERLSPIPGVVVSVRAGAAVDEPVLVTAGELRPSRAVPVEVVLLDVATSERIVVRDNVHAIRVGGRWAWVLPPERFAHYRADTCPDAAPPVPR